MRLSVTLYAHCVSCLERSMSTLFAAGEPVRFTSTQKQHAQFHMLITDVYIQEVLDKIFGTEWQQGFPGCDSHECTRLEV
jgi:hypothetical protein